MKALLSRAPGGPETLELAEVPEPVAGKGELLVRIQYCSINYPDVLVIEDKYQFKPPRPFAPGSEVSGTVEAVGEGVEGWAVGDRLLALTASSGGLAEKVALSANRAFKVPDDLPLKEASALLMTYATTIHGLLDRGHLKEGQTLLVLGAAGGVGLSAVELGKAFGARVIAAVSSAEKAHVAKACGADDVLIYDRAPFDKEQSKALADAFKAKLGPDGAHVIYDPVGGDYAEPALRAIAWEGRYLVVGFPAGIPKLPLNLTLLKSCDVCGVFWGAFTMRDPKRHQEHVATLFRLWREGKIGPRVSEVYPLERGGEAIAKLASRGAVGKLVVEIG
ncbi:MAG: NADPH:quinone oxidoreductase family protein [Proteobacteria bacterium]|nr:NADPH:quinone oxidoreductase family protein [Pseudomonadota bacterium]